MACNSVRVRAAPGDVFDVLDDACAYPRWVVGARRVRAVDRTWPEVGSRFHHALGAPGAELRDSSLVLARDRPRSLSLEVRFRPSGVARVDIRVAPTDEGSTVTLEEVATGGPMRRVPRFLLDPLLTLRNAISLQRLRHEVEQRAARRDASARLRPGT
jgi:hypothetical protein